jgi:hypothetical protein
MMSHPSIVDSSEGDPKGNSEGRESVPSAAERVSLPAWESFPTRDRQLLVKTIVQTARRQVQARPLRPASAMSLALEARG